MQAHLSPCIYVQHIWKPFTVPPLCANRRRWVCSLAWSLDVLWFSSKCMTAEKVIFLSCHKGTLYVYIMIFDKILSIRYLYKLILAYFLNINIYEPIYHMAPYSGCGCSVKWTGFPVPPVRWPHQFTQIQYAGAEFALPRVTAAG